MGGRLPAPRRSQMATVSLLRLLLVASLSGFASGRLRNGELSLARTFGEATVTPYNAEKEATPATRSSILLAETSMQSLGNMVKDDSSQPGPTQGAVDGDLYHVCERTRAALTSQAQLAAAGNGLPGGRVYKECMAALAPLKDHQQDSDAVDTLSDCMALVNALVAGDAKGEMGTILCTDAVGVMQAARRPPAAAPVVQPAPTAAPVAKAPPQVKAAQSEQAAKAVEALELVTEAMTSVCTDTVRDAEVGIKSETDAMKIANGIAGLCQEKAKKHLGSVAASQGLTKEWCHQLDGRLTVALETGFFFALAPEEAERQAKEANPYASTTRRKFCNRFVTSLRHQAENGGLFIKSKAAAGDSAPVVPQPAIAAPVAPKPVVAAVVTQPPPLPTLPPAPVMQQPPVVQQPPPPPAPLPTLPPAPRVQPVQVVAQPPRPAVPVAPPAQNPLPTVAQSAPVVAIAHSANQRPQTATKFANGADELHLVQVLSMKDDWNAACMGLVSRLTSEEGAVTEEYALGTGETPDGTKVLTFNPSDQEQVRQCAAQLKVLAVQAGIGGGEKKQSLLSTGAAAASSIQTAEDAEEIMDSPWATDVCGDIAHGYLTARLAHPGLDVKEFCPLYARDVQAMRGAPKSQAATQDMQMLRKGGRLKHRLAQKAVAAAPLKTEVNRPAAAALISDVQVTPSAEEQEGMDFWRDMLQS